MGAWGTGYFEDDDAMGFMNSIEESDTPKELIDEVLTDALQAEYLEFSEGIAAVVASVYIDRQVNGTTFSLAYHDEPLAVDTFPERHPDIDLSDLSSKAVEALKKVLSENSELHELWADAGGEDYEEWKTSIHQLLQHSERLTYAGHLFMHAKHLQRYFIIPPSPVFSRLRFELT